MKKIDRQTTEAFINMEPMSNTNTQVVVDKDSVSISLFGNPIAYAKKAEMLLNHFYITDCGWPTVTTKNRLNALPNVRIKQSKGAWYLNGEKWDGSPALISF